MRLVAWNANYNNRRRTLEDDATMLDSSHADVLIISETAPPAAGNPLSAHFVGGTPGLAVVSSAQVNLTPLTRNSSAPTLMLSFRLEGAFELDLLAVWPVSKTGGPSYHRVLMAALVRILERAPESLLKICRKRSHLNPHSFSIVHCSGCSC